MEYEIDRNSTYSPQAGAPTRPVPTSKSPLGRLPTYNNKQIPSISYSTNLTIYIRLPPLHPANNIILKTPYNCQQYKTSTHITRVLIVVDHLGMVPPLRDTGIGTHRSHSGKYRSSSDSRSSQRSGSHSGGRRSEDSVSHHLCCFLFTLVSVS